MNQNPFTQLKTAPEATIENVLKYRNPRIVRGQNLIKLFMRRKYKLFFLLPVLGYVLGETFEFDDYNFVHSDLSHEDIRYNREFQRMRFLEEPQFTGHNQNSLTLQMLTDEGNGISSHRSRDDLIKKNPHYKYF